MHVTVKNICLLICLLPSFSFAREMKLIATADNSIVIYPGEEHLNAGKKSQIRIKGNQHLVIMKFMTKGLRGRYIESAELVCKKGANSIEGVTISTLAADWDEYNSSALTSGILKEKGWGWPGGRLMDVCGSNGFTLTCFAKSKLKDGYYHWQVNPDLIYANVLKLAHGLVIHETLSDYSRNPTIFSREQKNQEPYLLIKCRKGLNPPPPRVKLIRLINRDNKGKIALKIRAPMKGFAYKVSVNGQPLPQWNIPLLKPGKWQIIPLRDVGLKDGPLKVRIANFNRMGKKSPAIGYSDSIKFAKPIKFPKIAPLPKSEQNSNAIGLIPLLDKYDAKGHAVGQLPDNYLFHNSIYNGRTIQLAGAKGEIIGFQVLVPQNKKTGEIKCVLPNIKTECFQVKYVKGENGKAMTNSDQLGLFVFSGGDIYQSLRLKAYRRAQQDIEYLLLLQKKMNWTDSELRRFIEHYLPVKGKTIKKFAEDAGTRMYDGISPENFRQLREATAKLLE